ncbi:cytidylyltransferase domain-containing protein, partial [Nguyenibacter vanlangensis]|nr:3-deoxy-manno-octulosonate cytidylyltransferase [Nguyenibacter vanlangensis]
MNPIIVIPARMASVRLPGKPLAMIGDRPMILHVLARARAADIGPVIVAVSDRDLACVVQDAGGTA